MDTEYKLIAPDIDRLLRYFERGYLNPSAPTERIVSAMEPLFRALACLAPIDKNDEVKVLWIAVPRGTIDDYDSFEDMKDYGEVETYEEYEALWNEDYPDPLAWYELIVSESYNRDGALFHRGVSFGDKAIISATFDAGFSEQGNCREDAIVTLLSLLTVAAEEAIQKLRDGTYFTELKTLLPYKFKTGVIKRSVLWEKEPEWKEDAIDGLDDKSLHAFRELMASGANDTMKIGRLDSMTANDFFRACSIGYMACGYDCSELPLVDQYSQYADGRDEGLTGRGYGLNEGPGIDFDDPSAWDRWYFDRERGGGHPWEVIRGGNSTHVDLFVCHDKHILDFKVRIGEITSEEAAKRPFGYYFAVAGKHRQREAVSFYVALSKAGLPVVLNDADEILARFEGTDYVGIVPHSMVPKYCESMFPADYGRVIDYYHVYDEDMELYGDEIEWLPVKSSILLADAPNDHSVGNDDHTK